MKSSILTEIVPHNGGNGRRAFCGDVFLVAQGVNIHTTRPYS